MSYRVHIEPRAYHDLEQEHRWIARRSTLRAEAWSHGAFAIIATLSEFPRRCPLAPENDVFDFEIRQLLYGQYRVLFTIVDDVVRILHIRHGAQRPMTADEAE